MDTTQDDIINISQPPQDILKTLFLTRQNDALESIREYLHRKAHSGKTPSSINVKAEIQTLFLDLEPHLTANYNKDKLNELYKDIFTSNNDDKLIAAYREINSFLYSLNLKRIDTRKKYDTTNAEQENQSVNL